ncbi:MAG: hypothetical protein ACLVJ6_10670 [Merdibacter sp.]
MLAFHASACSTKTLLRVVMIVALMTSMGTLAGAGLSKRRSLDDPSAGDTKRWRHVSD